MQSKIVCKICWAWNPIITCPVHYSETESDWWTRDLYTYTCRWRSQKLNPIGEFMTYMYIHVYANEEVCIWANFDQTLKNILFTKRNWFLNCSVKCRSMYKDTNEAPRVCQIKHLKQRNTGMPTNYTLHTLGLVIGWCPGVEY